MVDFIAFNENNYGSIISCYSRPIPVELKRYYDLLKVVEVNLNT